MKFRLKKDLKKGDLIDTNLGSDVCEEVKEGRWKPEHGNPYFMIGNNYDIGMRHWGGSPNDEIKYATGNVFRTVKEAEKALARQKAIVELEDLCDWEEGNRYEITGRLSGGWEGTLSSYYFSPWAFASIESVENAIKILGEEKLKLIFRIET